MNKPRLRPKAFAEVLTADEKKFLSVAAGIDGLRLNFKSRIELHAEASVDKEVLAVLSKHPDPDVRVVVAKNTNKSAETKALLMSDGDAAVRHFAGMTNSELERFKKEDAVLSGDIAYETTSRSALVGTVYQPLHGKVRYLLRKHGR